MSKPFLKWAGGKAKLALFVESHFPNTTRKRLREPFAGSAALSMALEFEAYLLNDTNPDLMNLFSLLKQEKQLFIDYAKSFFIFENNCEQRFYELRERFNSSCLSDIERSALFVYLNRHAFNGLCRYNSQGAFNVPFGRYKEPYFPEMEMLAFVQKSDRIELMCGDFQTALEQTSKDDIVYCDPPYVPLSNTASFTTYSKGGFDLKEQERLAKMAEKIAANTNGVLISNHDTVFTRELYKNARLETLSVQRSIAAKGSSRKKVGELLAIYDA